MVSQLAQLYRHRALAQILILRELKARYRGTVLGFLWSFINPLILIGVYTVVFSIYLRMEMPRYPAFLLSGVLPWIWFSQALGEATHSIITNSGIIKKVYLPSEIFPLVYVGSNMVHYLLSVPILVCFLLFSGGQLSWPLILFPWILVVQFLLTYGLALAVSALAVQFRDMLHIVPNVLLLWFFLTPVFYPVTMVPDRFRPLTDLNPMAWLIGAYQDVFFYNRVPPLGAMVVMSAVSGTLFVLGFIFFDARRDLLAEEV